MPDTNSVSGNTAPTVPAAVMAGNTSPRNPLASITPDTVAQARAAGYSDQEIVNFLSPRAPDQFNAALKAGYSPTEVLEHLAPQPSGVVDNLKQGVADIAGGVGKTLETHLGKGPVGTWLEDKAKAVAPANYAPASIVDQSGVHPSNVAAWLARRAPAAAAAIGLPVLAATVAPEAIGAAGATALAAGAGALMSAGNEDQTAAANRTGNPNATPSTADTVRGDLTALGESAVGALPVTRFLPSAGVLAKTGLAGATAALKKLGITAASEGAASAGQNVVGQVGQSVGTPGGIHVDPVEVADNAAGGALTGAVLGGKTATREALDATKYRAITPDLQPAATQFANRMQQAADGAPLTTGVVPFNGAQRTGFEAFTKARAAVQNELSDAVSDLRGRVQLPTDASNVLDAAMKGQQPTARDYGTVQNAVAGDPQAANVMNLLRQAHVADIVGDTGHQINGKFTGGISGEVGAALTGHNVGKTALYAAGGAALEGGAGHVMAYSPQVLGALAAATALARMADRVTDARTPAGRFVNNFADGTTPVRQAPPAPQAPSGPSVGPTGPKIAPAPTPWGKGPPAPPQSRPVAGGSIIPPAIQAQMASQANLAKLAAANAPTAPQPAPAINPLALPASIKGPAAALMRGAALAQKMRVEQQQTAPQPAPAIDPLSLPKTVTAPAANIMRGAAVAQKLREAQEPTAPDTVPAVNPLALPKNVTGPAATIMRGAALAQKLQGANGAQGAQAPVAQRVPAGVSKTGASTTVAVDTGSGSYKMPIAPYATLPVAEAAQRILRDQRSAGIPVSNSGAFLSKTIAVLNTVRDKVQAVTQAAPGIPPSDVARFEGIKTQKAAAEYRDYLKREFPHAAEALNRVFSNEAIAQQWAQKK